MPIGSMSCSRGFSLVESVAAAVIFVIAVAGVFASLAAIRQPAVSSEKKFAAALCTQQILEYMRPRVDRRDWLLNADNDTLGNLGIGTITIAQATCRNTFSQCKTIGVTDCQYVVTDAGNGSRKVVASIVYPD